MAAIRPFFLLLFSLLSGGDGVRAAVEPADGAAAAEALGRVDDLHQLKEKTNEKLNRKCTFAKTEVLKEKPPGLAY